MKNFAEMMKQAQALQGRMAEMQAELERTLVEGRSGGGMVVVTLTGKGDMAQVKIDPSLLKPEDAEILEDLIVVHMQKVEWAGPQTLAATGAGWLTLFDVGSGTRTVVFGRR